MSLTTCNNDVFDIGGWEFVAHQLAIEAGIRMSPAQALRFSHRHHTFITQRFDSTLQGQRLHFASAMTLVNRIDGDSYATGASYLELVEFISKAGSTIANDLEELWRRIVFFICISNTDDHLRNHGFLRTDSGWTPAPAYDVNPIASGTGLHLNISETDNHLDIDLALCTIGD